MPSRVEIDRQRPVGVMVEERFQPVRLTADLAMRALPAALGDTVLDLGDR